MQPAERRAQVEAELAAWGCWYACLWAIRYFYDADAIREPSISDHGSGNGYARPARLTYLDDDGPRGQLEPWVPTAYRNARDVWTIGPEPFPQAHFATFPPALPERCIKAGCPEGGLVLDPFVGSGTTIMVARRLGRRGIGIELNPEYAEMARRRISEDMPMFNRQPEPEKSSQLAFDEATV